MGFEVGLENRHRRERSSEFQWGGRKKRSREFQWGLRKERSIEFCWMFRHRKDGYTNTEATGWVVRHQYPRQVKPQSEILKAVYTVLQMPLFFPHFEIVYKIMK